MAQRKLRDCTGCNASQLPKPRGVQCYDERKLLHVIIDLEMGSPVEIFFKENPKVELAGYYLRYNRQPRTIHFQLFGGSEVQEISLSEICIIRFGI